MKAGIFARAFKSIRFKKRDYDPELLEISDIELPIIYNSMDENRILRDVKSELQTYKSLGYRFKDKIQLKEQEYHSFQIGILLNALDKDIDIKIPNFNDYLPKSISTLRTDHMISEVSDIIKKYDKEVPKSSSEIILRDQFIWTPIEAGKILYYLSIFKNLR